MSGKIRYALGATVNMGNYESARVDIALELPVDDIKQVPKVFKQAKDDVNKRIKDEINYLRKKGLL